MLKYDNVTSFVFNPEEAISFEGETGPYVQYAHARICSILEKHGKKINSADFEKLHSADDQKLVLFISKFPDVAEEAARSYKPHIISRYLIDLSQAFNEFYHKCPILQSDEETMKARLMLISAVKQVLENGLGLLGIEAPEKM
jgi:arginyl-tRNA synthetase